jgi:hypothetical protein
MLEVFRIAASKAMPPVDPPTTTTIQARCASYPARTVVVPASRRLAILPP